MHTETEQTNKEKMGNVPVQVGQVITTKNRRMAIPYFHEVYNTEIKKMTVVGRRPCIKLILDEDEPYINTGNMQGLVCFVPRECHCGAILSVRIISMQENSVLAEPVEWIEATPPPLFIKSDMGSNAETAFGFIEKGRAIWHSREKEDITCES